LIFDSAVKEINVADMHNFFSTRRQITASLLFQATAVGQTKQVPQTGSSGGTHVILIGTNELHPDKGSFLVGVRTSVVAETALVTVVFYEQVGGMRVLRSEESLAPIAGPDAYGATRANFYIPRAAIEFIRVKFFHKEVGQVDIPFATQK